MRFVDVKNDVAFRKIFGDEEKTVVLISFLNTILDLEGVDHIKNIKLIDPFQLLKIRGERASIIAVKAKDEKGQSFIIEIQVPDQYGFEKRIQYYSCKEYASQVGKVKEDSILHPLYFIGILNFDFFPSTNYFSKHLMIDEETDSCALDDIKVRFIELTKFKKKENELTTIIDKWTYFIKKADRLTFVPTGIKDKGLLAAYEIAKMHNWSKKEYDAYIYAGMREQDARGRLQLAERRAKERGIKQGIKQQKFAIIPACYKNNIPIPIIAKSLNMTVKAVEAIIARQSKKK